MSKKRKIYQDPQAALEAEKYERPVANRALILKILDEQPGPQSQETLETLLDIHDDQDQEALRRRLRAMVRDGQLVQNRKGRYGPVSRMDLIRGRVQGHRDGFGFVLPDDRKIEDLFLSPRQMRSVMDGDRVLVSIEGQNRLGKHEARVVEVLERASTTIVGSYRHEAGIHFIEPANRRIARDVLIIDMGGLSPAMGDHVSAEIIRVSDADPNILVRLREIIASPDEAGVEVEVALRNYGIPFLWSDAVVASARTVPDEVSSDMVRHREDLRDLPLVTIDGEDARDFDDAVYVSKRRGGGWRLVVAIADVSHYVAPDSALDQEAGLRGTSVYFPNRVVPMLPESLSNGICSLVPDEDRLCLYCDMQISRHGRVTDYQFGEGVLRSRQRLTYNQVFDFVSKRGDGEKSNAVIKDPDVGSVLADLLALFKVLFSCRKERGAIDFDTVETRVLFDERNKISRIEPVKRNVAHRMIEESMLAANVCAANLLLEAAVPSLYRNHEPPPGEKLESLRQFLGGLGLVLAWTEQDGPPSPAVFQKLTEAIAERPDRLLIQTVMLRSLSQARYEAENKGHFGLAYPSYTHFTSPIRRYPDLQVHRAIKALIQDSGWKSHVRKPAKVVAGRRKALPDQQMMAALGEQCSVAERRADEATRDVMQWLKCQYMERHVGAEMTGVISAVTGFGLFVQIDDLYIEGLVHVASLDSDYYHHDGVRHRLVGEASGRVFALGDPVSVRIAAVHTQDRKIDLMLLENLANQHARGKHPRTKGGQAGVGPGKKGGKKTVAAQKPGRKKVPKEAERRRGKRQSSSVNAQKRRDQTS